MKELDNSKIKQILCKIMLFIRGRKMTYRFYLLLEDLGVRIALSRFFNFLNNIKLNRNPIEEMHKSKSFFIEHKLEVNKVISILTDEKSKETYKGMIAFRGSFDNKILPYNSYRKQYFGNDYFQYKKNEVFIDCGSWDGDSIRYFKKVMARNNIKDWKCVAFEPDDESYLSLKRIHPDVISIKSAVGANSAPKLFIMANNGCSCFAEKEQIEEYNKSLVSYVDVKRLDDVEECKNATFIKMDIEGAEYEALLGAEKLIKTNKPKLAICLYHRDEDFIRIPLIIKEWVPEYKLYVMQHTNTFIDTVLYATI